MTGTWTMTWSWIHDGGLFGRMICDGGRNRSEKDWFWNRNSLKILEPEQNRNFYRNILIIRTEIGIDKVFFGSFGFQYKIVSIKQKKIIFCRRQPIIKIKYEC